MLQAYSTYALGAIVTIFAVLHNDLFAGARDYDSDIALPAACSEIVYPAGTLSPEPGTGPGGDPLFLFYTSKTVITLCQSVHTSKVAVPKVAPCLLAAADDSYGCYDQNGQQAALLGTARDKHGGQIAPTKTNLRHRVVEHMCSPFVGQYAGMAAEASCEQAKSMAAWALALTVAGWVLAAVGLHHAVYQASFILFTFAALALLVSWDAVMTMHAEQMDELKRTDGANPVIESASEPVLPALVISTLAISMFVHVYGFYRKGEGYEQIMPKL